MDIKKALALGFALMLGVYFILARKGNYQEAVLALADAVYDRNLSLVSALISEDFSGPSGEKKADLLSLAKVGFDKMQEIHVSFTGIRKIDSTSEEATFDVSYTIKAKIDGRTQYLIGTPLKGEQASFIFGKYDGVWLVKGIRVGSGENKHPWKVYEHEIQSF